MRTIMYEVIAVGELERRTIAFFFCEKDARDYIKQFDDVLEQEDGHYWILHVIERELYIRY